MSMEHYDQRLNHVEGQIDHLAADVRSLAGTVGQSVAQQQALGERFDRMADGYDRMMGQEKTIEWDTPRVIGVVGACLLGACLTVGGLFYGIAGYVDMRNESVLQVVAGLAPWMTDKDEFQKQVHYENGVNQEVNKYQSDELTKVWEHIHKQEEIDREHDKMLATAKTSRRAMGDYLKEHTNKVGEH